ncbi:hypothetical protein Hsar01_02576 [Haloferula sargassicola]|uniref:Uncharacterized protein n=1 Tax=Haloferula sargassicola TaxID=490096 RepID=A0ABP9USI9_9BACT
MHLGTSPPPPACVRLSALPFQSALQDPGLQPGLVCPGLSALASRSSHQAPRTIVAGSRACSYEVKWGRLPGSAAPGTPLLYRPRTKHQAPRTKHHGPSTTDQAPRTKHHGPSTKHQAPSTAPRTIVAGSRACSYEVKWGRLPGSAAPGTPLLYRPRTTDHGPSTKHRPRSSSSPNETRRLFRKIRRSTGRDLHFP